MGTLYFSCFHQESTPISRIAQRVKPKQNRLSQIQTDISGNSSITCLNKKQYPEFQDFDIKGRIGTGGYGMVLLGQLKQNQEKGIKKLYAIKVMPKAILLKKKLISNVQLEKDIMANYQCKFISSLHLSFQDYSYLYLAMDFAEGGDTHQLTSLYSKKHQLFKYIGQKGIQFIAACVILGLQFLHLHRIIYRDLKPENVLIYKNGYVKLNDFGLSTQISQDQSNRQILGTTKYLAPEMVLGLPYSKEVDLWSLGIYLYVLATYKHPYKINDICKTNYSQAIEKSQKEMDWKGSQISDDLKDLIGSLLKLNPKNRLGSNQNYKALKSHKFFQNLNWKALQQQKLQSPLASLIQQHPLDIRSFHTRKLSTDQQIDMLNEYEVKNWNFKRNIN